MRVRQPPLIVLSLFLRIDKRRLLAGQMHKQSLWPGLIAATKE